MDNHAEFEISCRYGGYFRIYKQPIKQPGQLISKAECGVVILHIDNVLTYPTEILLSPFCYFTEESGDAQFFLLNTTVFPCVITPFFSSLQEAFASARLPWC